MNTYAHSKRHANTIRIDHHVYLCHMHVHIEDRQTEIQTDRQVK